ncbi:MAG: GTP-binding protein [Opitutales bacterium]|nr:GTP-binding protein [Opitutales bacterium]
MTFTYRSRYQLSHDKLVAYLRSQIPGLLRAKGFAWTDREPDRIGFASLAQDTLRFDYLGEWIHTMVANRDMDRSQIPPPIRRIWDDSTGDRRQEIVFIGIDLDQTSIESRLDSFRLDKKW